MLFTNSKKSRFRILGHHLDAFQHSMSVAVHHRRPPSSHLHHHHRAPDLPTCGTIDPSGSWTWAHWTGPSTGNCPSRFPRWRRCALDSPPSATSTPSYTCPPRRRPKPALHQLVQRHSPDDGCPNLGTKIMCLRWFLG